MSVQLLRQEPGTGTWTRTPIPDAGLGLRRGDAGWSAEASPAAAFAARLLPWRDAGGEKVALVQAAQAPRCRVNGFPPLSVAVLEDRDELWIEGERLYVTTCAPREVERFDGGGESDAAGCALCGDAFAPGDECLRCGGCGALHHEGRLAAGEARPAGGERRCFGYRESCSGCGRRREDLEWTPDEAEGARA